VRVSPLLALILALTLVLSACGSDDGATSSTTTAGAGDGGSLTVYSGRDEEYVGPLIKSFKKANPDIDVKVRYGDSAELAATIREEGDRSPADLFFSQDAGALGALQDAGLLAQLPASTLDQVEAKYRSTADDWVGITGRARVLGYDSRKVQESDLPASVFDLTQPRWKGKVGWAPTNASFQSFVTAMRKTAGEDKTRQWLEDMQANDVQSYEKNSIIRDAIADGEIEAGLINHYYILEGIREGEVSGEDYPVKLHFFPGGDVGSLVNVAGIGVLKSAEQGANAKTFTDFLLERPQQEFFANDVGEYPLAAGVAQDPSLPALDEIQAPNVDLADLADLQGTLKLLQETGAI
jgi:iron(III) transport system substrate-binding protein